MKIIIPESCTEKRTNMHPTQNGHFCTSCQKEVIDFTKFSDTALKQYFSTAKGKTCGILRPDQIDRSLAETPSVPTSTFAKVWVALGLLWGFSGKHESKATCLPNPTYIVEKKQDLPPIIVPKDTLFTIQGVVKDDRGEILPGVALLLKDAKIGTQTDVNGFFSFSWHSEQNKQKIILQVMGIGYESKEIEVDVTKPHDNLVIILEEAALMGEVIVTKSSLPRRIWWKIKNLFRKKG